MKVFPDEAKEAMYLIRTHAVFKVVAYHPTTQTVDIVQDMFELEANSSGVLYKTNDFGMDIPYLLLKPKLLKGVPVKQLRWGQFSIKCCPVAGDTGYVEFFSDDISDWKEKGGPVPPREGRKFLRHSCVFVPFVAHKNNATSNYPTDNKRLIITGNGTSIELVCDPDNKNKVIVNTQVAEVNCTEKIDVTTPKLTVDGDIDCTGTVTATTDVLGGGISLKSHTHGFVYSAGPTTGATGTTNTPS